jgi:uncharacterized protein
MADYFLDTSALVKRYVTETGSAWITALTELSAANTCWMSGLTRVELLAALYHRVRMGTVPLIAAQQTEHVFRHELSTHFQVIPLDSLLLDQAMGIVAIHPLRAADAVQLATALFLRSQCLASGLSAPQFLSADRDLNQAAALEGMPVDDPNQHP